MAMTETAMELRMIETKKPWKKDDGYNCMRRSVFENTHEPGLKNSEWNDQKNGWKLYDTKTSTARRDRLKNEPYMIAFADFPFFFLRRQTEKMIIDEEMMNNTQASPISPFTSARWSTSLSISSFGS